MGMARQKRSDLQLAADAETRRLLSHVGGAVRAARRRRNMTQTALGGRAGISKSAISRLERASSTNASTVGDVVVVAMALGLTLRIEVARDPREEPADAGHLAIQELLLSLGAKVGYSGRFELPIRPVDPWRSIDVCLRDRAGARYLVLEALNLVGDVGAGVRSFHRKLASAGEVAAGHGHPGATIYGAWVVRATKRNRELVARYPAVFAATFSGSSSGWIQALTTGAEPPPEPGLVWSDLAATRVYAWRRPRMAAPESARARRPSA